MVMYVSMHIIIINSHIAGRQLDLPQVLMYWGADILPINA